MFEHFQVGGCSVTGVVTEYRTFPYEDSVGDYSFVGRDEAGRLVSGQNWGGPAWPEGWAEKIDETTYRRLIRESQDHFEWSPALPEDPPAAH
jgi:hypothetical protein